MNSQLTIHFFVQGVHKQGTYFRFHNLALGLAGLGHTIRVYGGVYDKGAKSRMEIIDGIEYHITACYFPLQRFFGSSNHPLAAVKRGLKRYPKCDISHLFQPHLAGYVAWLMNRKKAKKNIYDWDDLWTGGLVNRSDTFFQKFLYKQVAYIEGKAPAQSDCVTTCSHFLFDRANAFGASSCHIVYNGYWTYRPNTKAVSRVNLKLDPSAFYIGFMGRTISEIEWCFTLLDAVSVRFPNVRLGLCGMPEEALKGVSETLLKKIDYLGFLPPLVTRDFASAIDLGLLPLEDGAFNQSRFPIKFAEYLAASIPVLTTRVGECAELAKTFPFVRTTEPDKTQWANGGLDMIQIIINGEWPVVDKETVASILNWENISVKLEALYLHVMSE